MPRSGVGEHESRSMRRRNTVTRLTPREVIPQRYYALFLVVLFVSALAAAHIAIRPINEMDWIRTVQQVRNMWRGVNPFCDPYCTFTAFDADLPVTDEYVSTQAYSPWMMFYLAPLAYITARGVIALSVALWVVIVMDSGRPPALILIIHPAFLMLWATANVDFLLNGAGMWLIFRGVTGARWGLVLLVLAIKPQVLPLMLVLEMLRVLSERDWAALATVAVVVSASVLLYPAWLLDTVPSYLDVARGRELEVDVGLSEFPFSVVGAWGVGAALLVTAIVLIVMRQRLTEWRTLAVLLSLVWTPYVNPYSFTLLLVLFRNTPLWRVATYLGISLATLPVFFTDFHGMERYGTLLFLLLTPLLTTPDPQQTEEAIAARRSVPPLPGVRLITRRRAERVAEHTPAVS